MANNPTDALYSEEHEYLLPTDEESVYLVGITEYAQGELGDIVYVELPQEGETFKQKETFGTVEAVKAVSDLYCPAGGEVLESNASLNDDPSKINSDPYGAGWMVKLRIDDPSELDGLMGADEYEKFVAK